MTELAREESNPQLCQKGKGLEVFTCRSKSMRLQVAKRLRSLRRVLRSTRSSNGRLCRRLFKETSGCADSQKHNDHIDSSSTLR